MLLEQCTLRQSQSFWQLAPLAARFEGQQVPLSAPQASDSHSQSAPQG
jgi:hypothetical protein